MNQRPFAVTVVSWLIVAAGGFGLIRGFAEAGPLRPFPTDLIWIVIIDTIGIVCGVFMLRGKNWARWLTLVWLGCHVAIGAVHSPKNAVAHAVIFALIAYLLVLRPDVRAYFRRSGRGDVAE